MATVTQPIILDSTGQSIITALNAIEDAIENSGGGGGGSTVILDDVGEPSSSTYRYQRLTIGSNSYEIRGTKYMEQPVTLSYSTNTQVTFTSDAFTTDSVVDVYCSLRDVSASNVVVSAGSCIITFNPAASALTCTCKVYIR